jgi:NAD(P)H-hydrate repair Nnr-like enzyme with NAD(P)H-hydrate dehydratase domain
MGDVLSGLLGALLGQSEVHGLSAIESVGLGVCVHGAAADIASEKGQRGLAATDLIPHIRALLG